MDIQLTMNWKMIVKKIMIILKKIIVKLNTVLFTKSFRFDEKNWHPKLFKQI